LISAGTATNEATPFVAIFDEQAPPASTRCSFVTAKNRLCRKFAQAGFFPTESLALEWLTYIKQHDHPIKLLLSTSRHLSESLSKLRKVLPPEASPLVGSVPENQNRKGLGH
jgi:hypothetical protein